MTSRIVEVEGARQLRIIQELFREYEAYLGVDLCFQGFEAELAGLPGAYAPPAGALLLALCGEQAAGCVAMRPLRGDACEMKRLYVRSPHRGQGLGRRLAEAVIRCAVQAGHRRMRLDTLETLTEAMKLYDSLGFRKTHPYYENPHPGVVYWELALIPDRA